MNIFIIILIGVISFVIGFIVGNRDISEQSIGTIIIDHQSIPEDEPYLFLETKVSPRELLSKKTVVLDVVTEKFVSPE